jgi:hypothetical protein
MYLLDYPERDRIRTTVGRVLRLLDHPERTGSVQQLAGVPPRTESWRITLRETGSVQSFPTEHAAWVGWITLRETGSVQNNGCQHEPEGGWITLRETGSVQPHRSPFHRLMAGQP